MGNALMIPSSAPSYQCLSTDLTSASTVLNAIYKGADIYFTDTGKWYRVLEDLTLAPLTRDVNATLTAGSITVSGSYLVAASAVNIGNFPAVYSGSITNLPAIQVISGCITNFPTTQIISGCITNFPTTFSGSITNLPAIQITSGCITNFPSAQIISFGNLVIDGNFSGQIGIAGSGIIAQGTAVSNANGFLIKSHPDYSPTIWIFNHGGSSGSGFPLSSTTEFLFSGSVLSSVDFETTSGSSIVCWVKK
jgi:hypothetical protein